MGGRLGEAMRTEKYVRRTETHFIWGAPHEIVCPLLLHVMHKGLCESNDVNTEKFKSWLFVGVVAMVADAVTLHAVL